MLTGIPACAIPAPKPTCSGAFLPARRKTIAVLLSRSGKTTEVLRSLDYLRPRHPYPWDHPYRVAARLPRSDLSLVLTPVSERAVPTTRSVSGMILAAQLISALVAGGRGLPG